MFNGYVRTHVVHLMHTLDHEILHCSPSERTGVFVGSSLSSSFRQLRRKENEVRLHYDRFATFFIIIRRWRVRTYLCTRCSGVRYTPNLTHGLNRSTRQSRRYRYYGTVVSYKVGAVR